jgi:predicted DCC family thiol-disulfide oxidoreductase YuxK
VTALTVSYDTRCGLCCAVAAWVSRQPKLMPLTCAPLSGDARDLTVTADSGECWRGDDAWVMVLWALARYRSAAYMLASPALRPTARALFKTLSAYRGPLSCALHLPAEA